MRFVIALLAVAGIFVSSLALRVHLQDPSQAPPCAVSEHWDCGFVNHSRFATLPPSNFDDDPAKPHHRLPVATLGIVGYTLIAIAALTGRLWITLQLAEIGFACAAMLTYLEAYVMQKWCIYCVWSQCLITAILLSTIVALVLRRRCSRTAIIVTP
jgi:vitamin-K-epoxide reductase (warfarin-sensitive)